jgi:hypothetical protein
LRATRNGATGFCAAGFSLRSIILDKKPKVVILRKDNHYFLIKKWVRDGSKSLGWEIIIHKFGEVDAGEQIALCNCLESRISRGRYVRISSIFKGN